MTDLSGIEQMAQPDPRGILALHNLPPEIQRAEDGTQWADRQRVACGDYISPAVWNVDTSAEAAAALKAAAVATGKTNLPGYGGYVRPATDTERTLLAHLGYQLPATLYTVVSYETQSLRCRTWPQLETT